VSAGCRAHCRSCNSHFSSDSAFDAHRIFEPGHKDDWEHRVCADLHDTTDRNGRQVFGVKDEHGVCAVASAQELRDVRVWSLRRFLEADNPWAKTHERRGAVS
jgi:hypothetical protein